MKTLVLAAIIACALACFAGEPGASPFTPLLAQSLSEAERTAAVQASEDFAAVLAFKKPIHAVPDQFGISDGGSWHYQGKGYQLFVWHGMAPTSASARLVVYGPEVRLDTKLFRNIQTRIAQTAFYEVADLDQKLQDSANKAPDSTTSAGTATAEQPRTPASAALERSPKP